MKNIFVLSRAVVLALVPFVAFTTVPAQEDQSSHK